MKNKVRIIAGEWRGSVLFFDDQPGLRPTPGRVRETLFNWLGEQIIGMRCLDLFAGSGALGFEAISRGAASVTLVDNNPAVCKMLQHNRLRLKSEARITIEQSSAESFLQQPPEQPCDLVFIDPPFHHRIVANICQMLEQNGWLSASALIYLEQEQSGSLADLPEQWQWLHGKSAGEVAYHLYQRLAES